MEPLRRCDCGRDPATISVGFQDMHVTVCDYCGAHTLWSATAMQSWIMWNKRALARSSPWWWRLIAKIAIWRTK